MRLQVVSKTVFRCEHTVEVFMLGAPELLTTVGTHRKSRPALAVKRPPTMCFFLYRYTIANALAGGG